MNRAELSGAAAMAAQSERTVKDTFAALESRGESRSFEDRLNLSYVEHWLPVVDLRASQGHNTAIFTIPWNSPDTERILKLTTDLFRKDGYTLYPFHGEIDVVLGPQNITGFVVSWPHPLWDKD